MPAGVNEPIITYPTGTFFSIQILPIMLKHNLRLIPTHFNRTVLYLAMFGCCFGIRNSHAQDNSSNGGTGNLKYIDPRIGNVGQLLQPTRPTVQLPNQVIRMYPERSDYLDDQISSFPLTIVSHKIGRAHV